MKLATDNRSFEGQSAVRTEEFHVYLPQTRNSICYLLVQKCTSTPLIRQSRDNFINCSPYLSLDKTVFPVCFILMTRKTKELYVTSFCHELAPNFQPSRVMADYEDGFIVALKEVYGQNIHVEGCWFHFSQAVVRKAKKIGLSGAFRDDEHARKCIRCLTCLPLLPADDISNAVTDLEALVSVSNETNKPLLRRLLQYIQHSWLLKATIGPQRLSVSGSTQRTNNCVDNC